MKQLATLLIILLAPLVIVAATLLARENSQGQGIQPDEPFKVTSDTSNYTCIVSEVDNDLSLNCLKIK